MSLARLPQDVRTKPSWRANKFVHQLSGRSGEQVEPEKRLAIVIGCSARAPQQAMRLFARNGRFVEARAQYSPDRERISITLHVGESRS